MIVQSQTTRASQAVKVADANTEISLFADCPDVIGVGSIYQANEEIYGEGEPADRVHKVLRGVVRTYKLLDDGRRQIAAFYFPGDIFGLEPGENYSATAEAVVTAQVAVFQRRQIHAAASRSVEVARELWSRATLTLHHAESHMLLLGRKTALERVEAFLVEMSQRSQRAGHVNLPMSRRDIADYLGLTLETVSRALSQLQSEGGLQLSGARRIELRSRKLMGALAKAA
jgi:CRP/FNR family transcriptional regulator, nitrogen fixation regulation protein